MLEIDKLAVALVAAQAEFSAVPKGSVNPFFNSRYAGLPEVVQHTTPILSKHGLAVMQFVSVVEGRDALTTYVIHESGQYVCDTMFLHLPKSDPQGQGSAITYARRYAYMAALGIVADEDDDGNTASSAPAFKQYSAPKPAAKGGSSATAGRPSSDAQQKAIWAISHKSLGMDDVEMYNFIDETIGGRTETLNDLTLDQAKAVIEALKAQQE